MPQDTIIIAILDRRPRVKFNVTTNDFLYVRCVAVKIPITITGGECVGGRWYRQEVVRWRWVCMEVYQIIEYTRVVPTIYCSVMLRILQELIILKRRTHYILPFWFLKFFQIISKLQQINYRYSKLNYFSSLHKRTKSQLKSNLTVEIQNVLAFEMGFQYIF